MQNVACARPGEVPRAVPGAYPREAGLYPVAGGSCAGAGVGSGAAGVTGLSGPCRGWAVCECAAVWTGSAGMQHPRRGPGGTCAVRLSGFFGGSPRLLPPPGSSCVAEGLQGRPPPIPSPGWRMPTPSRPSPTRAEWAAYGGREVCSRLMFSESSRGIHGTSSGSAALAGRNPPDSRAHPAPLPAAPAL